MAIRRNNSDAKGRGKRTSFRRDEKPAGSSSYFKKKDGDEKPFRKSYGDKTERSSSEKPSSFTGNKKFGDREEKPFRKSYGDKTERSSSERPSSFRGKNPDSYRHGDSDKKSFRKSYGDKTERSSPERPSSFRGKGEFGDRDEKPFRKSYGDKTERSSSERPPSFRGKNPVSYRDGDRYEKPFRKSYGDKTERSSSERPPSFRGKKKFSDRKEKPFRKSFSDRDERSSERTPSSLRGKRDSSDRDEKPFRKSFGDKEERSTEKTPSSLRGKRDSSDRDEKPFRKSFGDREERSTEGPPSFRGKKEFYGDNEGKPFKKTYTKKDESSSYERPATYKGKKDPGSYRDGDRDEKPARKFADKRFSKGGGTGEFTERKNFVKKSFNKSKRNLDVKADDGLVRLNKYIANSGVCSRREADEFITAGLVSVNGEIVTTLGTKVKLTDDIRYNGTRMKSERMVYVLLNKPKDYITTTDDPQQRKTVMELVASACKERIYPVGRLDRNTTGLLLMTNDGDLADKMTHPSTNIKKTYMVELNKNLKPGDMQKIAEGIELEDGLMKVDEIAFDQAANSKKIIGVTIHSGRNRIVRRIFEHLGYMVVKLDRTYYAGLTKRDLPRGRYRHLDEMEINMLKMVKAR